MTLPQLNCFARLIFSGLISFVGLTSYVGLTLLGLTFCRADLFRRVDFVGVNIFRQHICRVWIRFTYAISLMKKNCSLDEFQGKSFNPRSTSDLATFAARTIGVNWWPSTGIVQKNSFGFWFLSIKLFCNKIFVCLNLLGTSFPDFSLKNLL